MAMNLNALTMPGKHSFQDDLYTSNYKLQSTTFFLNLFLKSVKKFSIITRAKNYIIAKQCI